MQGIEERNQFLKINHAQGTCGSTSKENLSKKKVRVPKVNAKNYFKKKFENISLYNMYDHMSP